MKVLIIGNAGREHAIAWKVSQSDKVSHIYVAPGNAGTQNENKCTNITYKDNNELLDFAIKNQIDLTIVGPELPLVEGIVDLFKKHNLKIFGPHAAAAKLEGSKIFAKEFMVRNNVATAKYQRFADSIKAIQYLDEISYPIVIKADGLAAGKGVIIAKSKPEAVNAINDLMVNQIFKDAGKEIVIEEFLAGPEASIICVVDKNIILPFISSKDHKQIFDDNIGPNTGGMGCVAPNKYVTPQVNEDFINNILRPTLKGLQKEELTYSGFLFFGVMITPKGCKLLEYNVRMGDPETQSILPMLNNDLVDVIEKSLNNELNTVNLSWKEGYSINVVLASKNYPAKPIVNLPITIDNSIKAKIFIAGAKMVNDQMITTGGRVMSVWANGSSIEQAMQNVYSEVSKVHFDGMQYRKDIGSSK